MWQSGFVRVVPITINRGTYRMRFFPSKLSADFWSDPTADRMEDQFLHSYLRPADTVVDIGANVGAETLTAACIVGPQGKVFAIEPQPKAFSYLTSNIALNNLENVEAFNVAIGETEGILCFSTGLLDTSNRVLPSGGQKIPAKRLDDLLCDASIDTIELMKVDVEGYELSVFRGSSRILRKTQCVYFEHMEWAFRKYGHTEREIFAVLQDCGLKLYMRRDDEKNRLAIRDLDFFQQRTSGSIDLVPVNAH